MISGGNILYDKAQEIFPFCFPGRVPVIYFTGFLKFDVAVLLLKKYLTLKLKRNVPLGIFYDFMNPLILERKFSQPEISLSQKYI